MATAISVTSFPTARQIMAGCAIASTPPRCGSSTATTWRRRATGPISTRSRTSADRTASIGWSGAAAHAQMRPLACGGLFRQRRSRSMAYACKTIDSPLGPLKLVASDKGLAAILWRDENPRVFRSSVIEEPDHPVLVETERQLRAYFAGRLTTFSLPLDFQGTAFQKRVWQA